MRTVVRSAAAARTPPRAMRLPSGARPVWVSRRSASHFFTVATCYLNGGVTFLMHGRWGEARALPRSIDDGDSPESRATQAAGRTMAIDDQRRDVAKRSPSRSAAKSHRRGPPLAGSPAPAALVGAARSFVARCPVRRCPVRRCPVRRCPVRRCPVRRCPVRRCPVRRCPVRRCPVRRCPVRRWPVRRWPVRRCPVSAQRQRCCAPWPRMQGCGTRSMHGTIATSHQAKRPTREPGDVQWSALWEASLGLPAGLTAQRSVGWAHGNRCRGPDEDVVCVRKVGTKIVRSVEDSCV